MPHQVLVCRRIPEVGLEHIRQCVDDCHVWSGDLPPEHDQLLELATGCEGILTLLSDRIDAEFFDIVGPQLKVISNFAVGYNNIDVAEARRRGIAVGNTPDVLTDATADIAVLLLLAAGRRIVEAIDNVRNHQWKTWEPLGLIGQDLTGQTVGIVGMGRIGQAVARRLHHAWGMRVLYTSRSDKRNEDWGFAAKRTSLEELLAESDFVSVHTDLNPSTERLFNADAFAAMKPNAVLVNTARGGVVDEDALYDALAAGKIFAAGLDVTDPEPLAADSKLRELGNCLILPHIGSATVASRNQMAMIAAENLIAGLAGNPLPHSLI